MNGTFGGAGEPGSGYRLTPWAHTRATLVANGDSMIALLQATLAGLLAASAPLGAIPGAGDGRSMAIRGEAGTVDELALALFADLQDQADALDCAVAGIEIAGMVRSEVGLFGWGYALLAAEPALALAPLRVVNREIVSPPAFGLTFTLERGGVDDSPCPR